MLIYLAPHVYIFYLTEKMSFNKILLKLKEGNQRPEVQNKIQAMCVKSKNPETCAKILTYRKTKFDLKMLGRLNRCLKTHSKE